jgi:CRP-like cAMP-binding protein
MTAGHEICDSEKPNKQILSCIGSQALRQDNAEVNKKALHKVLKFDICHNDYTMSKDKIAAYINRTVSLTDEESAVFAAAFREVKIKKRQFIVQPDFIVKNRNYVVKGAFRAYVVDDNGQDSTIAFAIEDWWITDYNSYILQKPATMFVVALEDSDILEISYENEQLLKQQNHKFETFFRIRAERTAAFMQQRIIANLTLSAEERYDRFIEKYPHIAQRVPQYALASYLGMTTEFLSRIRNKKTPGKKLN